MASVWEGSFLPAPTESRIFISAPAWSSHRPNHQIVSNFDSDSDDSDFDAYYFNLSIFFFMTLAIFF